MATILVVDDDTPLNDLLRSHLEAEGHAVVQAADGPSALSAVDNHHPHLILLDWMLPGMDGLAVCRRIRQNYLTPIIMLTARTEEVDQILGLEVGADDYIAKPFSIRQLLARVRAMLRRVELDTAQRTFGQPVVMDSNQIPANNLAPQQIVMSGNQAPTNSLAPQQQAGAQGMISLGAVPTGKPAIVRGDLRISPEQRQVHLAATEVDLTPKEFDLLLLLTSHPGWVFKREVLLQQIWGDSYEGFDRTIDNHITRLRKKLGPVGEKIDTVWGVGYRFKAE